jgi:hypothetical protein
VRGFAVTLAIAVVAAIAATALLRRGGEPVSDN